MGYDYDLFVIGAGPGGLAAAKQATEYGATVAIAEQAQAGGGCVNRGCIPKKLMVYAAAFTRLDQDAIAYGWSACERQFDWQRFVRARNQEIERLQQTQVQALQDAGIAFIHEHASFVDDHTLVVGDRKLTAKDILIAVGGQPIRPKIDGIEHALVSDDLFNLEALPKHIAILGGGYIGVEFASILRGLGCRVTLMNRETCILPGFDDDLATTVRQGLIDRGIQSLCSTTIAAIEPASEGFNLTLEGDRPETLLVDTILCATGRAPRLDELKLDKAGVKADKTAIAVDGDSRTNQPHIFAVGDCTNRLQLTPVARAEGKAVAATILGQDPEALNYDHVPSAVCSYPEAASVGLSEAKARETYGDKVCAYRTEFQPLFYSLTDRSQISFIKVVAQGDTGRVLGIHMVGDHAGEIIQSLTVALQLGVTKQDLDRTIGIHPSSAEEVFSL
ncbi:MAG: glutathione-disulfide reductase [Stenomitos rutilans HA7619-LM2]|jgi:glutathione reductase (NADPH)|nr:glutathione-disulfide reductase [Stenomitos rutilans HA7619-LM2]